MRFSPLADTGSTSWRYDICAWGNRINVDSKHILILFIKKKFTSTRSPEWVLSRTDMGDPFLHFSVLCFVLLFSLSPEIRSSNKYRADWSLIVMVMGLGEREQTSKWIALNQFQNDKFNESSLHAYTMKDTYFLDWNIPQLHCIRIGLEILIVNLLRIHLFFPFFMCHILCTHLANLQWTQIIKTSPKIQTKCNKQ